MNIFAKRLIGLAVSLAAIAYFGITHSRAIETYVKDRLEDNPDFDKESDAHNEKQD